MLKRKIVFERIWIHVLRWLPLTFSVGVLFILIRTLQQKLICQPNFSQTLSSTRTDIITISGILSGIIIAYLTSKVLQIRNERIARLPEWKELNQKVHKFRAIVNKLLHSSMWVDGLQNFVDKKYGELTYFDVRENIKVNRKENKLASEFISNDEFGDTANLYLELKSFLFDEYPFDTALYSEFDVPVYYHSEILEKWIKHDCGNGLWYYFSYKYGSYKEDLRLHKIYTGYQEDIKNLCLQIDKERYKELNFGKELLAKLGSQFHVDILPRLYRLQLYVETSLPKIINYLFIVLCFLITFGVALPLLTSVYLLHPYFDIISIGIIISICFYIVVSFYSFLKAEIRLK